ncbi:MAG: potassium channel family protein [Fusobacteriaceae bacterium]
MRRLVKKFLVIIGILITIVAIVTFGYMKLEGYSFLDALFVTVVTLATVGYSEVKPLTHAGRFFTIFVVLSAVTILLYLTGMLAELFSDGQFLKHFREVKMKKRIASLKNHCIIVGYGKIGELLTDYFEEKGLPYVIVEREQVHIDKLLAKYPLNPPCYILGDAMDDHILIDSGIKNAATFIPVLTTDADNLFITMSAKFLNPDLRIVARLVDAKNESKLRKAGATDILSPYQITAERLFNLATESALISFSDIVKNYSDAATLKLAKISVGKNSDLVGKTLIEAEIPSKTGLVVMGIGRGEKLFLNPKPQTDFKTGDMIIVIGKVDQIDLLEEIAR